MGLIMLFIIVYYVVMAIYFGCSRRKQRAQKINEAYDGVDTDSDSEMKPIIEK